MVSLSPEELDVAPWEPIENEIYYRMRIIAWAVPSKLKIISGTIDDVICLEI